MKQTTPDLSTFNSILTLIKTAKERIIKTVNIEIIDLYWQIGKEVSEKVQNGGWGKSVVEELSDQIAANFGNMRGFSPQNIWRMKQFYETYKDSQILSALLRELSWTNKSTKKWPIFTLNLFYFLHECLLTISLRLCSIILFFLLNLG